MRSTASAAPGWASPTLATTVATATPSASSDGGRARGGGEVEAERDELPGGVEAARPCPGRPARGTPCPPSGSRLPAAIWLLAKARPNVRSMPITSPVERISGPSRRVGVGEAVERQHRLLDRDVAAGRPARPSRPSARSSARVAPTITRAATLASGTPVALATNGTVRLARGLASMHEDLAVLDRELHVDQAPHLEGLGDARGCSPR